MDKHLNKKIQNRIDELELYTIRNRYRVGYDSYGNQQGYALFDKKLQSFRYITNKKWKVRLGLLVAKLFGWQIVTENHTTY